MIKNKCEKNIAILYVITFLSNLWFWMGIWVLYYLLFTDFAGIGLIETFMVLSVLIFEIPSGALADLIGKRKVLIFAFLVTAIAEIMMGLAVNFLMLGSAAFIGSIAITMVSGTFESITFDSLKKCGRDSEFEKVFSRQKSIKYFASAVATIFGGVLYKYVSPSAPFFAVGCASLIASFLAMFLFEPYDTVKQKVSFENYKKQLMEGFQQLFPNISTRSFVVLALLAGIVPLFMYEVVSDSLLVSYGTDPISISVGIVIVFIVAAISTQLASTIIQGRAQERTFIILLFVYACILLFAPFTNFITGVIMIAFLASIRPISEVIQSKVLNMRIASEHRATALSTFGMMRSIPYVLSAVFLGHLIDLYTAKNVVAILGVVMLVLLFVGVIYRKKTVCQ